MFTKQSKPSPASCRHGLIAAGALCVALASSGAFGQTAFGAAPTVTFPLVSSTATFLGHITLYNPNAADVTVALDFFDADNTAVPGAKACNDVVIPANTSVQFALRDQCTLEADGGHFGILVVSDKAGSNPILGYSRTENNAGAGFSIEGFPVANFTSGVANATGLRQSAAPPGYQTNCFVSSLGGAVTYDVKLFDGSSGAQIGNTLSGTLNPFEQFRFLDVFGAVAAPAGDYANVRAEFTRTSVDPQPLVGFCTVQDNVSFGADFRIAKDNVPATQPAATTQWQGTMFTIGSNQSSFAFAGPTATASLIATATITASGTAAIGINGGTKDITLNVCYQNQVGPGPVIAMGTSVPLTATTTLTSYIVSGSAVLSAGNYNIGVCAINPANGPVNKNGNTVGVVAITG